MKGKGREGKGFAFYLQEAFHASLLNYLVCGSKAPGRGTMVFPFLYFVCAGRRRIII